MKDTENQLTQNSLIKQNTFNNAELILPYGMFSEIKNYLFADQSREWACYLFCGHNIIGKKLRLLGSFLILPEPSEYNSHSLMSVQLNRELLAETLTECTRLGLSLIDIHSHPFSNDNVAFSGVDERDEQEKSKWFAEHLPHCFYGSIVMGKNSHQARIRAASGSMIETALTIRTLDTPLSGHRFANHKKVSTKSPGLAFDRHVRAFGAESQKRLGAAHIGIIGVGGLGAGLAISLARLGVKKFTLIDPDRVDVHNLNRLTGMTAVDAKLRPRKIDLVARELLAINPKINCQLVEQDILNKNAWTKLLRTDLFVTATDNHASRMLLNTLSQQYLLPQVSIGSLISTKGGLISGGDGDVFVLLPGHNRPCILCSKLVNPIEAYYEASSNSHRQEAARRGYIANIDEPAPAVVHLNGVLLNLALVEIHNLFCHFKEPAIHLHYDMFDQEVCQIDEGQVQCATCSPGGGWFGRGDLVKLNNVFSSSVSQ